MKRLVHGALFFVETGIFIANNNSDLSNAFIFVPI